MTILLKNPADNIDFQMTWDSLGDATITGVLHSVPTGLTVVGESSTDSTTIVRVSGAVHGALYQIKAVATLSTGRTLARTLTMRAFEH